MAIGDGIATCMVCAAPLDAEGVNCTRINAPFHGESQSDYGYVDAEWYYNGMFHTIDETRNAPPVTFLIKDFLQREGVTAIAAPVRERKSLIALNIAHSLVTGEKLFGHFEVVGKPKRVLYLCPEVSLGPFVDRLRKIGLEEWVGNRFFYRTLSAEGHLRLNDPIFQEALPGSVVFLDTAIRFLDGDENSSKDVRAFADGVFSLLKNGAESIVLLHHSPKSTDDGMMTLENAMRGSGDMGAFLACCWGTRLQDPTDPYKSASFLSNLKQRDFESEDFEVTCGSDCRMHFIDKPGTTVMQPRHRFKSNKDGRDAEALDFLKVNPKMSARDVEYALKERGIKRGKSWVSNQRYELMQENGGKLSADNKV
jgi:RecA-family ATPase